MIFKRFLPAAAIAAAVAFACFVGGPAEAEAPAVKTFGLIVTSIYTAVYETKNLDECPAGLAATNDEIWWKSLQPKDRIHPTNDGALEPAARARASGLRGPHGEDVCWNPALVKDPPLRTIEGKLAYGLNLDGTQDGHQTPNSCAHQKFSGLDGEAGIDNQLYRVLGCIHGWRADGYVETNANSDRLSNSRGTILIEVSGTGDLPRNGDVIVRYYKAADNLRKDSKGNILPYASYRIDPIALYGATAHGTIKDGLLTTEPVDAHIPYFGNNQETNFYIRGLRLRLRIDPASGAASGLIGGYHDVDNLWDYISKSGYLAATGHFSCPAVYEAAHRLADGYPDPKTGACTALSAAYSIKAIPAFVIHGDDKPLAAAPVASPLPAGGRPPASAPGGIGVGKTLLGRTLTTSDGMTLYSRAGDRAGGKSACAGSCLDDWRALAAPETGSGRVDWSIVRRSDDNTGQWAFRGQPLYSFDKDVDPGDVNGEGVEGAWHAVVVDPAPALPDWVTVQNSDVGKILADRQGRTLYVLNGNLKTIFEQICDPTCVQDHWDPVTADPGAQPTGQWTLLAAGDGQKPQWEFMSKPVYVFRKDTGPGQIKGNHFGGASVSARNYWSALQLSSLLDHDKDVNVAGADHKSKAGAE